ncbi:protein of unknown function [Roseovarius litoreus]|uniref:DUF4167 domain-containing protein n=2 Tax=Roseovarius litoreus TaxID=1155722 RepID=A0A1M7CNR3_9RHOB|nr:protein of unknown function [Roseovarius litoreus]
MGNIVNRVFESSGPEGKVRGTPQQIIDKYNQLARDAQLGNDRVAAENFQQHAEHYLRMLGAAQKEQDARREQQERENRDRQAERDRAERPDRPKRPDHEPAEAVDMANAPQPDLEPAQEREESSLVETPESQKAEKPKRPRKPRAKKVQPEAGDDGQKASAAAESGSDAAEAAE